jgi:hypothetical protein
MVITTSINASPGWTALQDGSPVPLTANQLGFLVVQARPSTNSTFVLEYRGTLEQRICAGISVLAWLLSFWLAARRPRPAGTSPLPPGPPRIPVVAGRVLSS